MASYHPPYSTVPGLEGSVRTELVLGQVGQSLCSKALTVCPSLGSTRGSCSCAF